jgi:hypothetical protein
MRIRAGRWLIRSDPHGGFALAEMRTQKSGKRAGQEYEADVTYHATLELVCAWALRREAHGSPAQGVVELLKGLQDLRQDLCEAIREVGLPR